MKSIKPSLWLGLAALCLFTGDLLAQTPPSLAIQLFAGLNVTGTTGSVYTIQYVNDLAQTNAWTSLAFLQLPVTNFLWVDTSAPVRANRFYRAVLQAPPTNMVFIPANTFNLGSPTNEVGHQTNEAPQTTVTITRGYWIGKFEVTQAEFLAVTGSNPSTFTGDLSRPVESVSCPAASNYCAMLTQQELAAGRIPAGTAYRLPTEAEWEYAARAGTSTRFYYGEDPTAASLPNHAWFTGNSGLITHPVGQKLPNAWGLYDMEGNVLEWTQDWFTQFPGAFAIDPQGPPDTFDFMSQFKATRGGAYDTDSGACRSAARGIYGVSEFLKDSDLGFRVVLAVP